MAVAFMQNIAGRVPPAVLASVSDHLKRVEQVLQAETRSEVAIVEKVGSLTLDAGGKRLRPALVAVSACASGNSPDPYRMAHIGACLEMIHMASLVHDDVMDGALTRRGRPTAGATVGNEAAILSGDALLARAMGLLARDGDLRIIRETADAVVKTVEGQVQEIGSRGQESLTANEYLTTIDGKTGAIIEACCRAGARLAEATVDRVSALARYGRHIGRAFQIVDDLLDYRGDHRKTGKPWATDLREGCATWPYIDLLDHSTPAEREEWVRLLGRVEADAQVEKISLAMKKAGSFTRVAEAARAEVAAAKASLGALGVSAHVHLLDAVADFVVERDL